MIIPVKATIAVGKNPNVLLIMMMVAPATESATVTFHHQSFGQKLMTGPQTKTRLPALDGGIQETTRNGSKRLQIGGDLYDDECFLAGLGRKLVRNESGNGGSGSRDHGSPYG